MERSNDGIVENIKDVLGHGGKAFRAKWPYIVIGLFAGLVLSLPDLLLNPRENPTLTVLQRILITLSGHLGTGFFVSSIAVFLYEWGSHEKELRSQVKFLVDLRHDYTLRLDDSTALFQTRGKAAIQKGLNAVLPGEDGPIEKIRDELYEIAINIHDLRNQKQDIWAKDSYLRHLRDSLESVKKNSASLNGLHYKEAPQHFDGVVPAADNLLTHLLECLNTGDEYYTITHLHTWTEEHLPLLWAQTEPAVGRGVIVKRVFNLVRDCSHLDRAAVKGCLQNHAKLALDNKCYEAKIVKDSDDFPQNMREELENGHFVLIKKGESAITINVRKSDLSKLTLSRDQNRFDERKRFFDSLSMAIPLKDAPVEDIISKIYGS